MTRSHNIFWINSPTCPRKPARAADTPIIPTKAKGRREKTKARKENANGNGMMTSHTKDAARRNEHVLSALHPPLRRRYPQHCSPKACAKMDMASIKWTLDPLNPIDPALTTRFTHGIPVLPTNTTPTLTLTSIAMPMASTLRTPDRNALR